MWRPRQQRAQFTGPQFLCVSMCLSFLHSLVVSNEVKALKPTQRLGIWKRVLHPKSNDLACLYWNASRFWPHRLMQTLKFGELKSRRETGVEEWKSNSRLSRKSKWKLWGFTKKKKKKKPKSNVGRAQRCFRGYCHTAAIHKPQLKITTSLFVRVWGRSSSRGSPRLFSGAHRVHCNAEI